MNGAKTARRRIWAEMDYDDAFLLEEIVRRPLVERVICAILDEPVLDAFGYPHPSPALRGCVAQALRLRARALRHFPPRRRPRGLPARQHPSYPRGYREEQLGAAAAHMTWPGG